MRFLSRNNADSYQQHLRYLFAHIIVGILFCLIIVMAARKVFIVSFVNDAFAKLSAKENFIVWWMSLRFDVKYVLIAYALPFVVGILCFKPLLYRIYGYFFSLFNLLVALTFAVFAVVNYFYYQTYDKIIDTYIFAAAKEDPTAVMNTVIESYPLVRGLIALVVFTAAYLLLFAFVSGRLQVLLPMFSSKIKQALLLIVTAVLMFGGMRGSLGEFPLRQLNATVSSDPRVNAAVPNGVIAFQWAYKWNKLQDKIPNVSLDEIMQSYADLGIKADKSDPFAPLLFKTPKNEFLEQHRPDIVLAVMESMSTHMLTYDDPSQGRDLLGSLRQHVVQDYFFLNFLSEGNGTSDSLTRLVTGVPDLNLSTSSHSDLIFKINLASIFKNQGYEVVFITSSTGAWRDFAAFLRKQGFDRVYERAAIEEEFPNATSGAWGIDDEFLYKKALGLLKQKHDKPLFVMTLSITNHPPYRVPKGVEPQSIKLPKTVLERFPYPDTETIFATFRYANDQLGKFISSIKDDEFLKNDTVIAATGDHNLRGIVYSNHADELVFGHAVPFYLYLPSEYALKTGVVYEKNRFGSHKDVLVTIASHTLSDSAFYTFGCDLLSDKPCNFPYAFNSDVAVNVKGGYACSLGDNPKAYAMQPKLMVDDKKTLQESCKSESAFNRLVHQLYYFQVNESDKNR